MEWLTARRAILFLLGTCLAGCATHPATPVPERASNQALSSYGAVAPSATVRESGPVVLQHIQQRYGETGVGDCRPYAEAQFLCSGILMRATAFSTAYRSWLPNPATASWGISFSWLRRDSDFPENYPSGNGFIVYPQNVADQWGDYHLDVACIYPRDAWTGAPRRCTTHRATCQTLGITTAEQWLAKGYNDDENQCAFNVDRTRDDQNQSWNQVKIIRDQLNGMGYLFARNEVVLKEWPQDVGARMPVEAFFYRDNCFATDTRRHVRFAADTDASGKGVCNPATIAAQRAEIARKDQADFVVHTGRWVPIIRWTPTVNSTVRATFRYIESDQGPK